ncbi:hypothetical protein E4U21_005688 [Claviceps maximensis]|nr:hypothetical protein E4U21_005688 [Claviceps maximensis]
MSCERDIDKIAKSWAIAMSYSEKRLKKLHDWQDHELEMAAREGKLVLETVCLFVHACVKHGQYEVPHEFWRLLHVEYGIVVYPSALTEDINVHGLGMEVSYTEAYCGHVGKFCFS